MNLLIYSRLDFTFKANLPIESFEIVLDTIINSESSFVISGSGGETAQEDIAILHERSFFYIGIVKKISAEGIKTKINTTHFNDVLETEYLTVNYPLGNLGEHIKSLITNNLISNPDSTQNMTYLQVRNESIAQGVISVTKAEVKTIAQLISELNATNGLRIETRLGIVSGEITHLKMVILDAVTTMKLRYDLALLRNLSINEDGNIPINKAILYGDSLPTLTYYLLADGSVTTNMSHPLRITPVKYSYIEYQSGDDPLMVAKQALIKDKFLHAITFDVSMDNQIFIPFTNIALGDQVEFITKSKTIPSILSQIAFKGTLKECSIILGEHRMKLTEKLKMIERRK